MPQLHRSESEPVVDVAAGNMPAARSNPIGGEQSADLFARRTVQDAETD